MPKEELPPVTITMTREEMIGDVWRLAGDVVEVHPLVAKRWVEGGYAKFGGVLSEQEPEAATHELGEFPGADKFAAVGITTLAGVTALIAQHGDAWPKQVKGITKPMAAKVSEVLEAMNKPAEPPAAE